jgi:transcriptional regulator with XRE-family HTH domain
MPDAPSPARHFITTEDAGLRLRRVRERLGLRFRDVEVASQMIADRYGNEEFVIGLSRLSEIENRGLLPSIYRVYSLSTIYRLDFAELLSWYGIRMSEQGADSAMFPLEATHEAGFSRLGRRHVIAPLSLDPGVDFKETTYLSRLISKWGPIPLDLFKDEDLARRRIGFMGTEDWSMYPLIRPGSLLLLNNAQKIQQGTWKSEWERPIYFLEHRDGFLVGWCSLDRDRLIVLPHHSSHLQPKVFLYPQEIELVGQVKGVAMLFDHDDPPWPRP